MSRTLANASEPDDALTATVTIEGDDPPDDLADAVDDVLQDTIIHLLDGDRLSWRQDGDAWVLTFCHGMPESYTPVGDALPIYRTAEQFEGADGSGDGLLGNLPGDWAFEPKNRGQYIFGRWD